MSRVMGQCFQFRSWYTKMSIFLTCPIWLFLHSHWWSKLHVISGSLERPTWQGIEDGFPPTARKKMSSQSNNPWRFEFCKWSCEWSLWSVLPIWAHRLLQSQSMPWELSWATPGFPTHRYWDDKYCFKPLCLGVICYSVFFNYSLFLIFYYIFYHLK
jgi:hypothetical protein